MLEPRLSTRPMVPSAEDLVLFKACFEANGDAREMARLRWQYVDNPAQRTLVDLSISGDSNLAYVAAIYATLPVRFQVNGRSHLAVQSLDTITDQRHRGKGLFVSLAKQLFARAAETGVSFVYGFPNSSSAPGFFKKLDWVSLDPLPMLLKPLRSRYFAARLPKVGAALGALPIDLPLSFRGPHRDEGLELRELDGFDASTDEVWREFSADIPVALDRTRDYMTWRFRAKPNIAYRIFGAVRKGRLEAFVVTTFADKHGGRIGYIMDVVQRPDAPKDALAALRQALAAFREAQCDAVLAWCFEHAPNYPTYRRAGFLPLPERVRPIKLHFGVRAFDPALRSVLVDRRNWYLSYCDSDTV